MIKKIITKKYLFPIFGLVCVLLISSLLFLSVEKENNLDTNNSKSGQAQQDFAKYDLLTDTSTPLISLDKVLSGGPGKDGIPAIDNPKFVSIEKAKEFIKDEYLGLLVEIAGEKRFYPNNILVWHEIVNDKIGDIYIAVTFCPLCGSSIVFDRKINEEILEFGVSGLLYESNLLMFDRKTESLWSQIEGRSVVGNYSGTELKIVDSQLITFGELQKNNQDTKVLSTETGKNRDYTFYPYGDYETNNASFIFPITYKGEDISISAKEIMYASNINGVSVSFVLKDLREEGEASISIGDKEIIAKYQNGTVNLQDLSGQVYPGFYSMWFSWANHNLEQGVNDKSGQVWFKN